MRAFVAMPTTPPMMPAKPTSVIVMPGVYLVVTRLFARTKIPRAATLGWGVALVYGFVDLFPFRNLL